MQGEDTKKQQQQQHETQWEKCFCFDCERRQKKSLAWNEPDKALILYSEFNSLKPLLPLKFSFKNADNDQNCSPRWDLRVPLARSLPVQRLILSTLMRRKREEGEWTHRPDERESTYQVCMFCTGSLWEPSERGGVFWSVITVDVQDFTDICIINTLFYCAISTSTLCCTVSVNAPPKQNRKCFAIVRNQYILGKTVLL